MPEKKAPKKGPKKYLKLGINPGEVPEVLLILKLEINS
jgi:hypothetical protein